MIKKMKFLAVSLLLMIAAATHAQVTTSSMSGRVTDNDGAVIGATVIATHEPSGTTYGTVTNTNGNYALLGMRTGGPYKVEISYIGYNNVIFDNIYLQLGETSVYDVQMKEANQLLDEVVVLGDRSAIFNSRRTGAATNFNKDAIERTPSVSRSIFDVTKLTPQATVVGGGMSFGGSSNKYNSFQIDGTVNNDVFGLSSSGTNGGQSGANPISLEAIEEVQVVIAPFDVRQSGFTGAGVNAITKSGTNKFSGSVYDYYNNQNFVGTTAGKGVEERKKLGTQSSNTLGFTFGGPIIKNKLFFFANAEHVKESYPSSYNVGDGSNITKEEADQVMNKVKELSGGKYDGGGYGAQDIPTQSTKFLTRIDWNINNQHKLTARYSYVTAKRLIYSNSANSLNLNNHGYNMNNKTHSFVTELNSRFSNELSNELRFGYTQVRDHRGVLGEPFPYVNISMGQGRSIQLGTERFSSANRLDQDIFTLSDNLTWFKGNHTLTFGTHNEFFQMENLFIRENFGSYFYNSLADFLSIGTPNEANPREYNYSFSREDITGSKSWAPSFGAAQLGFYAQDEWAVNKLLKLTYGLRADIPVFFDKPGANTAFNGTSLAKEYQVATDQMPKTRVLLSPRIGFRYNTDESRRTLIRGGAGIFTGRVPFVWISNSFSNTGVEYSRTRINKPDDFTAANNDGFKFQADPAKQYMPSTAMSSEINVLDKDFKFPQVLRANLAVEQVLPGNIKATLEGLYSKTLNNILYENIAYQATGNNLSGRGGDTRPLYAKHDDAKNFTNIIYLTNTNLGYTYSITAKLEKDFDFGLNAMLAYTLGEAKAANDGTSSQAYSGWQYNQVYYGDSKPELSYSLFDVRHRVVGALSYKVEYARNFATTLSLMYNGQSGSRYGLVYNGDLNGDGAFGNDVLYIPTDNELASMTVFATDNDKAAFGKWINDNEQVAALKGTYVPRYGMVAPFEHNFDLRIAQDFYFNVSDRRHTFQVNFDVLNVGNLLNRAWGLKNNVGYSYNPIKIDKGRYVFDAPTTGNLYNISDYNSRWRAQIGLKYIF